MKQSRIFSVAVASAAVLGSVVAVSGTANAAFDPATAIRVTTTAQLGVEGATYPADGWFRGNTGAPAGTVTFDGAGLNSAGGNVQVLNAITAQGSALTALVTDATFVSDGAATFQVPLYVNATGANTEFTTLRPVATGDEGLDAAALWITSRAFGTYAAGAQATLAQFQAEINRLDAVPGTTADNATILGYGFITPDTATSSVQAVAFGTESTWFIPEPTGTYQPATVTVTQARTTGITVDGAGFFPHEALEVYFAVEGAQSADPLDVTLTADAQGRIQATAVIPADAVPAAGSYAITIGGVESGIVLSGIVTVTADAAVAPVPAGPVAPVAVPVRANAAFTG